MTNHLLTNQEKAHQFRNLKFLLQERYWFRLYIKFRKDPDYNSNTVQARHFYGNEHRCTYNQCINRKVPHIILDRLKGYNDLVHLIERGSFRGQYLVAKIYGIDPATGNYDILHRTYLKGKLQKKEVEDPTIDPTQQYVTLYYSIKDNRLIIHETEPTTEA